jgi:hypothetical protein
MDESEPRPDVSAPTGVRPAYYAAAPNGGWRDWWTLLHPPYTLWHLSYVVIGASLAPHVHVDRLVATVLAFFFAVGVSAHALDELNGRPLRTQINSKTLVSAAVIGIAAAVVLGAIGVSRVGWELVPFIVVGPILIIGYNLEVGGTLLHNDIVFAVGWGAFPVLTAYVAEAGSIDLAAVLAALAAMGLSSAQRALSTPARFIRRRTVHVHGVLTRNDGVHQALGRADLLRPIERALNAMSASVVLLATALALSRLT